ncbi:MAG TPA: vWA domain-containing protein [Candidatus Sulfotelmatobacter sp.]
MGLLCLGVLLVRATVGQDTPTCAEGSIAASVIDQHGVVPPDLDRKDFRIAYGGRRLTPLSVVYTEAARRVIVLLDVSGSMDDREAGKWQTAVGAALDLVADLPPGSKLSLMTFSEKTVAQVPLSTERKPMEDWLRGTSVRANQALGRKTALYAAIRSAVAELQPSQVGDAIYIITDGGENASQVTRSQLEALLTSSGVRLFALIVPSHGIPVDYELYGREDLLRTSENSGGSLDVVDSGPVAFPVAARVVYDDQMKGKLRIFSRQLSVKISAFYSIRVRLPEAPRNIPRIEVSVLDARGRPRKDLAIAYPHKISPMTCGGSE